MKNVEAIKCYCFTNPDLVGLWKAKEVKKELDDFKIPDAEWIEYLLSHIFSDYEDFTSDICNAIANDAVKEMTLMLGSDEVTIKKFYYTNF